MVVQTYSHIVQHFLALAAVLYLGGIAAASDAPVAVLVLDPTETRITFTVAGFPHTVHGAFRLTHGTIHVDGTTGKTVGIVTVDAASGVSGNGKRDAEMRDSILETQQYPEIRFSAQQVTGLRGWQGEFPVKLSGSLWLHGAAHDLTAELRVHIDGDAWTATSRIIIPYVAWGLKNPSFLMFRVSEEVTIDVSAVGTVSWPLASRSPQPNLPSRANP